MLICPTCHTENLPGAFFCNECGSSFLPSTARDTTTSLGVPAAASSAPLNPPALMVPESEHPSLRIVILNSGRKLNFSSKQPILIGRQDRQRNFFPDLDLTVDGGLDAGVSRRHAQLMFSDGGWMLEDLGSSNGTFVNKQAVDSAAPHTVQHGDEVRLGNILLRLELIS